MLFQFIINLTDEDYLDYNVFWNLKSAYGKKTAILIRVICALCFSAMICTTLLQNNFSIESGVEITVYALVLVLFQVFFNKFFSLILKAYIKSLKKKGKVAYSPVATMEFWEESFIETTPENKTETKYSSIERVSLVADKIYIHVNNFIAYIIPISCFKNREQYEAFLAFISTKCAKIDDYRNN